MAAYLISFRDANGDGGELILAADEQAVISRVWLDVAMIPVFSSS